MTPAPHLGLGLILTAAAGMIDVVGFIELGGYYTSFMSGNTTQLGAAFTGLDGMTIALPLGLIAMFFVGSFLGAFVAETRAGSKGVLSLVLAGLVVTLALHGLGASAQQSMLALAIAAGAQNAVLAPKGAVRLGATFVTGTLFAAGQDLARALRRQAPPLRWAQHLMVWFALMVGALVGAAVYSPWHQWSLLLPGAIYAVFLAGLLLRRT
jgi:uncharacterized membrane protein YoaK (UPF0700 family)